MKKFFLPALILLPLLASCGGLMGELAADVAAKRSGAFSLVYDANGADSGSVPVDATEYLGGETATIQGAGDLVKDGYRLAGWTTVNDRKSQAGTSYAVGASLVMGKADARLYAVWLPGYLTYEASGNVIAVTGCNMAIAGDLSLPAGVTAIGEGAFLWCARLMSLELPDSVKSIGERAFGGCSNLASIELPAGLTSINDEAFIQCSSLTQLELLEGIERIEHNAFAYCDGLHSLVLPSTLTTMGVLIFESCHLVSLTILAVDPPKSDQSNFMTIDAIYVPADSLEKYKAAAVWSSFSDMIFPIPTARGDVSAARAPR